MKYAKWIGWLLMAAPMAPAAPASGTSLPERMGTHVLVFNAGMPLQQIQDRVDAVAQQQVSNQFGPERYALLFEPGTYGSPTHPLNFQVGYYTQVSGLGATPDGVVIHGTVQVRNQCFKGQCGALDNFWRSLSNLTIQVPADRTGCESGEIWAASQAAPLRRVRVLGGELKLTDTCTKPSYASGGFIADSQFERTAQNGAQQQFLVRNSDIQGWSNGSWNQVFSGVHGAPARCFPAQASCGGPYTTLAASPVVREAPFLFVDSRHRYQVFVPGMEKYVSGTSWSGRSAPGQTLDIDSFFVASPADSAANINTALASGKNLILSPGVYHLRESIAIRRPDTIVLGFGIATLVPEGGVTAMTVVAARGVSISGLLFDAGDTNSSELLRIGVPGVHNDASSDPTTLHDVFFRIGGATPGRATVSLVVNSDDVILDDIWAWRADHGQFVGWTANTADTGLIVNGNNVTAYGLYVEHYQKTEVIWNGNNGTDIFFQNEMPYDPPLQPAWREFQDVDGFSAFKVGDAVTRFHGYGMGSYCYFNQGIPIYANNAFVVPSTLPSGSLQNLFTIFLDAGSGGIRNVINDQSGSHTAGNPHGPVTVTAYP